MPQLVTTHIFLEDTKGWTSSRKLVAHSSLDEGFDRPYWFNSRKTGKGQRATVPKSWDTALVDGIIHVLITYDPEIKNFFSQLDETFRSVPNSDLDVEGYFDYAISILNGLDLGDVEFSIAANAESSVHAHSVQLDGLKYKIRWMIEPPTKPQANLKQFT